MNMNILYPTSVSACVRAGPPGFRAWVRTCVFVREAAYGNSCTECVCVETLSINRAGVGGGL